MTLKQKIVRCLRCATCDKESLNRCLLKWCKCFKEVEKELNRCKNADGAIPKRKSGGKSLHAEGRGGPEEKENVTYGKEIYI